MEQRKSAKELFGFERPFAITMWDFSWLERRWPGAGYEDFDLALSELKERGYDAVRIDAYPHLLAADPDKNWLLKPEWSVQCWGSYAVTKVTVRENLKEFLAACRRHGIKVGLSTWFREDEDNIRKNIKSPKEHAQIWIKTLDMIKEWGELDNIIYVDLCNEFPGPWAPFFTERFGFERLSEDAHRWIRETAAAFKAVYGCIPVTFSCSTPYTDENEDFSCLDFIEAHIWMANAGTYYQKLNYNYERFSDDGYTRMMLYGKGLYFKEKELFDREFDEELSRVVNLAKINNLPIITTECWSVVDYKDGPLLDWDWILDLNERGIRKALKTNMWAGLATSNFCGPQFVGMWREKDWHKRMTDLIHGGTLSE